MTKEEKRIQIALGTYLPLKWEERNKLCTEGDKLYAEGRKLYAGGNKLHAEGSKLYAEAVIEVYGPKAMIDWDTGEVDPVESDINNVDK